MLTEKVFVSSIPFGEWWWFPVPQTIIGGLAFARVHQPTVIKLAFPETCAPTRTTGIGMKKFCPICILSIGFSTLPGICKGC